MGFVGDAGVDHHLHRGGEEAERSTTGTASVTRGGIRNLDISRKKSGRHDTMLVFEDDSNCIAVGGGE
jgi:hypothetical protein